MNNILLNKAMYIVLVAAAIILSYLATIKLFFVFLPFVFGIMISKIIIPMVNFLHNKLKLPNNLATAICILLVIGASGFAIYKFTLFASGYLVLISEKMPTWINEVGYYGEKWQNEYKDLIAQMPVNLASPLSKGFTTLLGYIGSFAGFLGTGILSIITNLPGIFITVIITMVSAFFFTKDRKQIEKLIHPVKTKYFTENQYFQNFKRDVLSVVIGYIKAQSILMTITFIVSAIGLSIIGVPHAIPIALSIGFVDALPILGPASFYMPWILYTLITGGSTLALKLFIMYLITTITRQICEPKILGHHIGMHPLVTLSALYGGVKLLGPAGLFIGPFTAITLIATWRRYFKKESEDQS